MMPRLGVSVTEGTVSAWLKEVGDAVEVGEPICEVATDKVDTEIESTVAGLLTEQRYAVGDVVPVGEALAVVGEPGSAGEAPDEAAPDEAAPALAGPDPAPSSVAPAPAAVPQPREVGTPAVVRPAAFDHVAAVAALLRDRPVSSARVAAPVAATAAPPAAAPSLAPATGVPAGYDDVPHDVIEPSRVRQVIAEHMRRSRDTAAHMTTEVDVDLGRLTDLRAELNQRAGLGKLSYLPFVARAVCSALREHPDLNATFDTTRVLRWRSVNLGVAVDTPRGLMVPVVRRADELTLDALARAISELAEQARTGRLDPDHLRAGTFTLTNPGSVGAVAAPAIINQPQVAILGMPTIVRRPCVVRLAGGEEGIAVRPILRLALTFDHRWVDGADATRALVSVRDRLESWSADDYL
jgi:2-oxoglutarate dehydrogenase E2 component (dihydrolipoamide succinyltransferase)